MNPRRKYHGSRNKGEGTGAFNRLGLVLILGVIGLAVAAFVFRPVTFDVVSALTFLMPSAAPPVLPPTSTLPPAALPTPAPITPFVVPTATPHPLTPTPTQILTPLPTQEYFTQAGDTLPALAARFGVNPADIRAPDGLLGGSSLVAGRQLFIPQALEMELGPGNPLIPDSELVFRGGGFDPTQFAAERGGYLARYRGFAEELMWSGGEVVMLMAQEHSLNPRLLTALLEYESGWVTDPNPQGDALLYPLGWVDYRHELTTQLSWATAQLAVGYYGWRAGSLTEVRFPDGSTLRLNPTLNAGTVALQYFFAQLLNRPAWDEAVGPNGFAAAYARLFGDPFTYAVEPLLPADLTQPPLALPFMSGQTWAFTGGPHGAWEHGGARAALDFAPYGIETGCVDSPAWVTAVAAGTIVRSSYGAVMLDLDGDGREYTGWDILFLHIADEGRVAVGTVVEKGDRIGHPSCRGGIATGTHVHLARKYNGEWVPADGPVPFNLNGWVAHQGAEEYDGTLTRAAETVTASTSASQATAITNDQ